MMFYHHAYLPQPDWKPQTDKPQAYLLIKFDELCKRGDAIDVSEDERMLEQISFMTFDHKPEHADVYQLIREFILERPAYWGFPDATAKPPHDEEERKHCFATWYSDEAAKIIEARTHKPVLETRVHDAYLFAVEGDMFESSINATHYGCYELGTHMLGMPDIHSNHTTFWIPKESTDARSA
jgi:hypothetical protein